MAPVGSIPVRNRRSLSMMEKEATITIKKGHLEDEAAIASGSFSSTVTERDLPAGAPLFHKKCWVETVFHQAKYGLSAWSLDLQGEGVVIC